MNHTETNPMQPASHYIHLLEKYTHRSCNRQEMQELLQWLRSEDGERMMGEYLDSRWQDTPQRMEELPDEVSRRILSRVKERTTERRKHISYRPQIWQYVAAVCLLLLVPAIYWILSTRTERGEDMVCLSVQKGNKAMAVLADGSRVWLNSGSSLWYSRRDARRVRLEGEAFFEVTHRKCHRFVVSTPYGCITVYGTSFNVQAHPSDSLLSVALVRGSIGLTPAGCDREWRMHPDEIALYDARRKSIRLAHDNLVGAGAWRCKELKLEDADIATLWSRMGGWYSMRFVIKNKPVKNHLYNMTVQTESVQDMLETINKITPIEYVIKEKEVIVRYR